MKFQLMDLFAVGWLILSVFGMNFAGNSLILSKNEEYLSKKSCKYYRGIFALSIVLHHIAQRTCTGTLFHYMFNSMGAIAVSVFFFISGYGLQKSFIRSNDYSKGFLKNRLTRILLPYFLITIARWMECFLGGRKYSIGDVLLSIAKGKPIVPFSWYIIVITVWYVIYWTLMKLFKQDYLAMITGSVVAYLIYAFLCIQFGFGGWWYNATPVLILGMFWAVYETKIMDCLNRNRERFWIIYILNIICIIGFYVIMYKVIGNFESWHELFLIFENLLCTVFFVLSIYKIKIGNCMLSFLGEISLEIYLVQGLVIEGPRWGISNEFVWCIYIITVTILVAYIFHIFNKIVINKLL